MKPLEELIEDARSAFRDLQNHSPRTVSTAMISELLLIMDHIDSRMEQLKERVARLEREAEILKRNAHHTKEAK